ncbi:MAG TPA: hypothetical protein VFH68_01110 [Polyangia bacterium]|jgi:hypothetical protein|nr:hypothetical protein [Polyangia bacterium]
MARNFGTILILLVTSTACRRQSPPPAAAPVAPSPAPIATAAVDAKQNAAEPPAASAETPDKKAPEVGSAATAASEDETSKRKAAVRAASEQQRPLTKELVRRLNTEKIAGAPSGAVAAREEVAAAPASAASPSTAAASPAPPAAPMARARLRFRSDAGAAYKLVEARFVMDGAELPTIITGAVRGQSQRVFSGEVTPGRHVVASTLTYQGADRVIFTYMKGYTFRVQSEDIFVARADRAVAMTIVCKEKTGFNTPIEKRLVVTVE